MTSNITIPNSCISCITLRNDNLEELIPLLNKFHSRDASINQVINRRPSYFIKKGDKYDNRDTIYLYIFTNPETNEKDIIGYISCAASSLSAILNDQKVIIPCVVINTFAISSKYTDKTGIKISNGKFKYKCSLFVMYNFLDIMDSFSYKLGITHVYLFAQQKQKVVNFYKNDCKFTQINANLNILGLARDDREYAYVYSLKNGRYRF